MSRRRRGLSGKRSKIFISYRWADSAGHAGRLAADLKRHFGEEWVFMDVSGIEAGEDFVRVIEEKLASSAVLIAVIGKLWLQAAVETDAGKDQPGNWVRLEISTALEQSIQVIPVLVDGAAMPPAAALPEELKPLARTQAVKLRDDRWDLDLAHLIRVLERCVPAKRARTAPVLAAVLALALIGTLWLTHYLATVPLAMKPNADGKFSIPPAALGTHEVVIEGPVIDTPTKLLLSQAVGPTEEITVEMERAQLSRQTVEEFGFDPNAASAFGPIRYGSASIEQAIASRRTCDTLMEVKLKEKLPEAIHFSQARSNPEGGGSNYREMEVESVGAELVVTLSTTPNVPEDATTEAQGDDTGPGCWKHLVAEQAQIDDERAGLYAVECIASAGSPIRPRFLSANTNHPSWEGEDGPLTFVFGSPKQKPEDAPPGLQARAVSVKSFKGDSIFDIRSVDGKDLLRVDSLALKSKQLQLSVSGEEALVTANGENVVGLRERVRRYPGRAALLAMTTITLSLCLALLIRRLFRI
jgi:hypothetical protein